MTSFQDLVDLAFGGPEDGQINFNALHSLLYALVFKLKLSDEKAIVENEILEKIKEGAKNYAILKSLKESIGVNSFVGLAERLKQLEIFWEELNGLPSNEIVIKTIEANVPNQTPLSEMWDILKTNRTVEASENAISKLFCLLEDLMKFSQELDQYNKELSEALLGGGGDEEEGKPQLTVKEAVTQLGDISNEFELMNEMMKSITDRMGEGTMPTDEFFDNLPTWTLLEQLMKGTYENTLSGKEKRELGLIPLSEEMKKMLADLGIMVAYNDELLARIQTIENNLQYLTDRAATKADIQKLNIKMAEVQGIAGAVDRLLCRIQGSEDQLCCLRQVINKIYGCVSNTAGGGTTPGIMSCLGGKGEGGQTGNTRSSGGNSNSTSGGGVNETQLKIFMDQLTKVECEMDAIKRNLVSVDGIKADVQNLFSIVNELDENKLDKCLLASEMAQKADKSQIDDKVSQTCFENTCQGFSTVIQDILAKILENDSECRNIFSQLEKLIQMKSDKDELETLKDQLESKLKCMAKNFVGLQKFVSEDGDTGERSNVNQNQNDGANKKSGPINPAIVHPSQLPKLAPPSLPLNPGFPGNKVLKQFPLVVKGTEIKGANLVQPCGVKPIKDDVKVQAKKNSLDDFKPTPDICKDLFDQDKLSGAQRKVFDTVPQLSDMKDFVSNCQKSLTVTMNTMRACTPGPNLVPACDFLVKKEERKSVGQEDREKRLTSVPNEKTTYAGLVIGSEASEKPAMDFGE